MVEKNRKLQNQFEAEASTTSHGGSGSVKPIFDGVSIFVDGFTVPSSQGKDSLALNNVTTNFRTGLDLGPSLREICAANRTDEKQQIKALLQSVGTSFCPDYSDWFGDEEAGDTHSRNANKSVLSKFLQSHPADYSTTKLQIVIKAGLLKEGLCSVRDESADIINPQSKDSA
uniref:Uncharacterized protein n=1 Tax=Quercus lobata TaxID=97700 RepID=A0A7N2MVT7_QUELO